MNVLECYKKKNMFQETAKKLNYLPYDLQYFN